MKIKPEAKCLAWHQTQKRISTNRYSCYYYIPQRGPKLQLGDLVPSTEVPGVAKGKHSVVRAVASAAGEPEIPKQFLLRYLFSSSKLSSTKWG